MGALESTIFSYGDKSLVLDRKKEAFWVTYKEGNEILRTPVALTIKYLSTDVTPLRTDIPLIVILPSKKNTEGVVVGKDMFSIKSSYAHDPPWWKEWIRCCPPSSCILYYELYVIDYRFNGTEMNKEFQIYRPGENTNDQTEIY